MNSSFKYRPGLGHVGAFQVSSIPYASASIPVPASGSSTIIVNFPLVTKFVTVRNPTLTGSQSRPLRFGWSYEGVTGGPYGAVQANYVVLDNGESYTGEWKVKSIHLMGHTTSATTASVIAGMTNINTSSLSNNWSGSLGVG